MHIHVYTYDSNATLHRSSNVLLARVRGLWGRAPRSARPAGGRVDAAWLRAGRRRWAGGLARAGRPAQRARARAGACARTRVHLGPTHTKIQGGIWGMFILIGMHHETVQMGNCTYGIRAI